MMAELIRFPDVEMWATTYLHNALAASDAPEAADVYVGRTTPNPREPRMVVVRRDGGPQLDVVREIARLGIQVWAETPQDATALAGLVRAMIRASPDGNPVLGVNSTTGPSPVDDPSGQPLRYFTAELVIRGAAA